MPPLTATLALLLIPRPASATEQCFYTAGIYGNLTVTTSGDSCGSSLSYGGITGLYIGAGSSSGSCTFKMSAGGNPVDPTTLTVAMTAHSNQDGSYNEEAEFLLDVVQYIVTDTDIDNTTPAGGFPLLALPNGRVGSVANVSGDGRGTISFGSAMEPIFALTIAHYDTLGSPEGTIYLPCVDDSGVIVTTDTTYTTYTTGDDDTDGTTDDTSTDDIVQQDSSDTGLPGDKGDNGCGCDPTRSGGHGALLFATSALAMMRSRRRGNS